eukprot:gene206-226_t
MHTGTPYVPPKDYKGPPLPPDGGPKVDPNYRAPSGYHDFDPNEDGSWEKDPRFQEHRDPYRRAHKPDFKLGPYAGGKFFVSPSKDPTTFVVNCILVGTTIYLIANLSPGESYLVRRKRVLKEKIRREYGLPVGWDDEIDGSDEILLSQDDVLEDGQYPVISQERAVEEEYRPLRPTEVKRKLNLWAVAQNACTKMVAQDVPNLPGYSVNERKNHYGKHGFFAYDPQTGVVTGRADKDSKMVLVPKKKDAYRQGSYPETSYKGDYKADEKEFDKVPAWLSLDGVVLRFYGYYQQEVPESNLENFRIRDVCLLYFLADDTIKVHERKIPNSGIVHSAIVSRSRIAKHPSGIISHTDLVVGQDLTIHGRTYKITGCDPFTRKYYDEVVGATQPEAIAHPMDTFTMARAEIDKSGKGKKAASGKSKDSESGALVCRFFAVMDDMMTPTFERRPFSVLCWPRDNTIEIREHHMPTSDNYTPLPGQRLDPEDCYKLKDLGIDKTVNLMGNKFYLYDADSGTREHFKNVLGQELPEAIDVAIKDPEIKRPPTPPYTGYGTWEDSMGSVTHLNPSQPKRNTLKRFHNTGKSLRCELHFEVPEPEDVGRKFVATYQLWDDCFLIHEDAVRNSGHIGGRFLETGVHLNEETGCIIVPYDLTTGNRIRVNGYTFKVGKRDSFTDKWFANDTEAAFPAFQLEATFHKIREGLRAQFPMVKDIFRKMDEDKSHALTLERFQQLLWRFGFIVGGEKEAVQIMKRFDGKLDGQVDYPEFCDALLDKDCTDEFSKDCQQMVQTTYDPEYHQRCLDKQKERKEVRSVLAAVQKVSDFLYKNPGIGNRFRCEFSKLSVTGFVTQTQLQAAFSPIGFTADLKEIEQCMAFADCMKNEQGEVDYQSFIQSLYCAYGDLAKSR